MSIHIQLYIYVYVYVYVYMYTYMYVYIHIHILRGGEIRNPHWTRQWLWKWGSGSKCKWWWWWSYKQVIIWVSMVISHKKLHIASYGHIMMWPNHDHIITKWVKMVICSHVVAQETWLVGGSVCIPIYKWIPILYQNTTNVLEIFVLPCQCVSRSSWRDTWSESEKMKRWN